MTDLKEVEIYELSDKEFKILLLKKFYNYKKIQQTTKQGYKMWVKLISSTKKQKPLKIHKSWS